MLITATPYFIDVKSFHDDTDDSHSFKYCSQCDSEYYGNIEVCPDCENPLIHKQPDQDFRKDEFTSGYWENPSAWAELYTPSTYSEGFDVLRYLRNHDIDSLGAFKFNRADLRPITFEDIDKLEINFAYSLIENPKRLEDTVRSNYPMLLLIVPREQKEDGEDLISEYKKKIKSVDTQDSS